MGFPTRVFDLFYKRLGPTGSIGTPNWRGYLPEFWFTSSISSSYAASQNLRVSGAYLNFPDDTSTYGYVTTRDSQSNSTYVALPWASHAADFLWNVRTPSWSYIDSEIVGSPTLTRRNWGVQYTSKSFHKTARNSANGVSTYPITSSWVVTDPKFYAASSFFYLTAVGGTSAYPTYVNSTYAGEPNDNSATLGYNITYPTMSGNSISSVDGQYFDLGGGALIARADISRSLVTGSTYYTDDTATGLRLSTEALKARRLYFPTPVSQSGQSTGTDYWFKSFTGYKANDLFTDNGGIYNIQFTLKKQITLDSYPDNNTFMSVFIHNVIPQIPSSSARVPGALGWYPPENNIVRVGNGYGTAPAISFYDIQTGYTVEKFNINVIQYGYPAQLCIEASGSLADNAYFGIIIDDIQMCKVGVTTDPRFIKPYSLTQVVQNTSFVIGIDRIDNNTPPPSE